MVGLVILYDHVHPQGAFVKGSNVDVSTERIRVVNAPTHYQGSLPPPPSYPLSRSFISSSDDLFVISTGERLCQAVEGPTALQERGPPERSTLHHEALERGEHAEEHKKSAGRMITEAARLLHQKLRDSRPHSFADNCRTISSFSHDRLCGSAQRRPEIPLPSRKT